MDLKERTRAPLKFKQYHHPQDYPKLEAITNSAEHLLPDFCFAFWQTPEKVFYVEGENGVICVLFPDRECFGTYAVQIHTILARQAWFKLDEQLEHLRNYLKVLFGQGVQKVTMQVSQRHKLIVELVQDAGFTLEGTHRNEGTDATGIYDMLYYGMLKEEFNG